MARITITLEDLPGSKLRLSLDSEPPMIAHQLTLAQLFGVAAHAHLLNETGAPISEIEAVTLIDHDSGSSIHTDEMDHFNRSHQRPPHE